MYWGAVFWISGGLTGRKTGAFLCMFPLISSWFRKLFALWFYHCLYNAGICILCLCQLELKALRSERLWYPALFVDLALSGFKGWDRERSLETSQTSWVQRFCQSDPWGVCSCFASGQHPEAPAPCSPAAILSIDFLKSRMVGSDHSSQTQVLHELCGTPGTCMWSPGTEGRGWWCPAMLPQGSLAASTPELQCSSYGIQLNLPPCFKCEK